MSFDEPRKIRDPRTLSALAHPVRMGILEALTVDGPLTATELGDRLDESPANCSWHLRKLSEHDFVEEAPGEGRKRPWRIKSHGMRWSSEDASGAELVAGYELEAMMAQRCLDRFLGSSGETDAKWRDSRSFAQTASYVTVEELKAMIDEVVAVIRRHEDRIEDASKRPEGAQLCEFVMLASRTDFGGAR